jgi:ClpP class serine protease
MPSWSDILDEIRSHGSTHDAVRRQYLRTLQQLTDRNVIAYYSGWLQKPIPQLPLHLNDADKNGFMNAIYQLDESKGLDLLLHTPGGETAATESLVDYLHAIFGTNIRVFVPQLAMSAGTMIACAAKEIFMGKHSSLGPIDPQLFGVPAHGVVEEFLRAHKEIKADPSKAAVWQPIVAKYNPTLIGECEKAIKWSNQMVREWLLRGMLADKANAGATADKILNELGDHSLTMSHARHLSGDKCRAIGLTVTDLEVDQKLQDAVLSVHHAFIHTLGATRAYKIIENHDGKAFIQQVPEG